MDILEKLIKVINSCETHKQLAVAYKYYMRVAKTDKIDYEDLLMVFRNHYMDKRDKINASVVERYTR